MPMRSWVGLRGLGLVGAAMLVACASRPPDAPETILAAGDPVQQKFDPVPPPNGFPAMPKSEFGKAYGGTPPPKKLTLAQEWQKEFDRCIGGGGSLAICSKQAKEFVQRTFVDPTRRHGEVIVRDASDTPAAPADTPAADSDKPKEKLPGLDLAPVRGDKPEQKK